jgi:hypothetical protein
MRMFYYNKGLASQTAIAMTIMKMGSEKVTWSKNITMKEIASKVQKAPTQKKVLAYNGKPFAISQFTTLPNGDMLFSGQLTGHFNITLGNPANAYTDLFCFHLDAQGNLKAQYGYTPLSIKDKLNKMFPIYQQFIPASDGKSIVWVVLENKTWQGYDGFFDAYHGIKSYMPTYYPNVVKIDAAKATLTSMETLGQGKYKLNRKCPYIYSADAHTLSFLGSDGKGKVWLGKYQF